MNFSSVKSEHFALNETIYDKKFSSNIHNTICNKPKVLNNYLNYLFITKILLAGTFPPQKMVKINTYHEE